MTYRHSLRTSLPAGRHRWRRGGRAAAAAASRRQPRRRRSSRPASSCRISGEPGTPPRLAVPDFLALSRTIARRRTRRRTIGEVLWDDLEFRARVLHDPARHLPVDPAGARRSAIRRSIAGASSAPTACHGRGAEDAATGIRVEMRLYSVRARQQSLRRGVHADRRPTRGCTRTPSPTKSTSRSAACAAWRGPSSTFSSDRNRERVAGTVEKRDVKEVYIADYDGANQRRITVGRQLNITPIVVAGRPRRSPTRRGERASWTSSSRTSTRARCSNPAKGPVGAEFPAGVLAGRDAHRVHVESRRQLARFTS